MDRSSINVPQTISTNKQTGKISKKKIIEFMEDYTIMYGETV